MDDSIAHANNKSATVRRKRMKSACWASVFGILAGLTNGEGQ